MINQLSLTCLILLGVSSECARSQGFDPPPPEVLKLQQSIGDPPEFGGLALRSVVRPDPLIPPAQPEGQVGESCVGWTIGYGLLSFLRKGQLQNPYYVYHWALDIEKGGGRPLNDEGIKNFDNAFKAINFQGSCDLKEYLGFDEEPSPNLISKAATRKSNLAWHALPTQDLTYQVRKEINRGKVVPAGFCLYTGFTAKEGFEPKTRPDGKKVMVWTKKAGYLNGYHAMLIIGYDNDIGAFEALNSQGIHGDDEGHVWIDYDFFERPAPSRYGNDCCICAYGYADLDADVDDDLIARIKSGQEAGWIRLVQPTTDIKKSDLNFNLSDGSSIKDIEALQVGTKLVVKAENNLVIRNDVTASSELAPAVGTLKTGEEIEVLDMQKISSRGGRKVEYWVKGKISDGR